MRIDHGGEDIENTPDLSISPEKVCYIFVKAREFDAQDFVTDPDDGSTIATILWSRKSPRQSLPWARTSRSIWSPLLWLGRGDGSLEDWNELRAEAARAHNKRTASYLLGMPLLADYLDEALAQFGHSCGE